jgi:hypothetical protein
VQPAAVKAKEAKKATAASPKPSHPMLVFMEALFLTVNDLGMDEECGRGCRSGHGVRPMPFESGSIFLR